jgi:hypothetical protein
MRRSRAARPGLVGTRGGAGGATASRSSAARRSRAARRFSSWLRSAEAVRVSTPSVSLLASRRSARSRICSGSAADRRTSNDSSTRLSVVLTDCPPGPDDLENRSRNSLAGITSQLFTRRSSATPPSWPARRTRLGTRRSPIVTWGRNRVRICRRQRGMRTTHSGAPGRRLIAVAFPAGLTLIAIAALAGCSGSAGSASSAAAGGAAAAPAAAAGVPGPAAPGAASGANARSAPGAGQAAAEAKLRPSGQRLIYTAQLKVRARDVSDAVSRATAIAAGAGGYVAAENASSDPNHPDRSTATIELKIPVAVYAQTLAELSGNALGTRLSLQRQAQDVTQQVADINSRVTSDEAAIAQHRELLKRAGSVGDLLSVQNQIDSQESDLEAMQAQQRALNHETAYATVMLTIVGPKAAAKPVTSKPAPGLSNGLVGGWRAFRTALSWLLAIIGAIAPFAAVIAVLGALGYWGRRWLARRGSAAQNASGESGG